MKLEDATTSEAAAIAALRLNAARELTAKFGRGTWSFAAESEGGVLADIATSRVLIARQEGLVVATLRLSRRSPWLFEPSFFTACHRPLYLTSMAVAPKFQRQGVGRACLEDAKRIAAGEGVGALRLDAYDAAAGAGEFYRKCGFREVRRSSYNGTPLIFFEFLLGLEKPPERRGQPGVASDRSAIP
ncbi:MAG TPA: GNAT family N-acetyltransferase [Opitutaceae bacterium]|nr:GNAT family N-acetyltransferase [Opitutaceae bacterium]